MDSAQHIIGSAAAAADGATVKAHLHSGQTIEGTLDRNGDGTVTIADTGGTVWTIPVAHIAALGAAA
ncbi:hypothetical protein ACIQ8D_15215 [Streptomyces sp. NPDC096094]|uniref:hypothetical protein n=1 Tax=Streptomyces sp. NPDC096094 TaxID=3366073 RepID=UPI0037F8E6E6